MFVIIVEHSELEITSPACCSDMLMVVVRIRAVLGNVDVGVQDRITLNRVTASPNPMTPFAGSSHSHCSLGRAQWSSLA